MNKNVFMKIMKLQLLFHISKEKKQRPYVWFLNNELAIFYLKFVI